MLRITNCLLAIFACLAVGTAAQADLITSDISNFTGGVQAVGSGTHFGASQFTINSAVTLDSADLYLQSTSASDTTGSLTAAIYQNSSIDTVGSAVAGGGQTGISGTLSSRAPSDINFTFGSLALAPGTYWLELTWSAQDQVEWFASNSFTSTGTLGTINARYYAPAAESYGSGLAYEFQLNGQAAAAVPEPSSLAMVAIAGVGGLIVQARRRASKRSRTACAVA